MAEPDLSQALAELPERLERRKWLESPERRKRSVSQRIIAILAALSGAAAFIVWFTIWSRGLLDDEDVSAALWAAAIATSTIGAILGLTWYAISFREFLDQRDQERRESLRATRDEEAPQILESELTRVARANRAVLYEYQRPVRAQARTSYIYSQVAILVGLIVLLAGLVLIVASDASAARFAVAGVTAVGTALSGYIARTYLRVYEKTQDQLNFYFREPLISSYLLTAERLTEMLSGERREQAYAEMVRELVRTVHADLHAEPGGAPDSQSQ